MDRVAGKIQKAVGCVPRRLNESEVGVEELEYDAARLVEAAGPGGAVGDRLEDPVERPRNAEGREVLGQEVAQGRVDDCRDGHHLVLFKDSSRYTHYITFFEVKMTWIKSRP